MLFFKRASLITTKMVEGSKRGRSGGAKAKKGDKEKRRVCGRPYTMGPAAGGRRPDPTSTLMPNSSRAPWADSSFLAVGPTWRRTSDWTGSHETRRVRAEAGDRRRLGGGVSGPGEKGRREGGGASDRPTWSDQKERRVHPIYSSQKNPCSTLLPLPSPPGRGG